MDGSLNQTSILIPGIANNNGVLVHQIAGVLAFPA